MRFKISNLAQVKEAVLEDSDLSVIIGDNGTGKTLLLESRSLIKKYFSENISKIIPSYLKNYTENIEVEVDWGPIIEQYESRQIRGENDKRLALDFIEYDSVLKIGDLEKLNSFFQRKMKRLSKDVSQLIEEKVLLSQDCNVKVDLLDIPHLDKSVYESKIRIAFQGKLCVIQYNIKDSDPFGPYEIFQYTENNEILEDLSSSGESIQKYLKTLTNVNKFKDVLVEKIKTLYLRYFYESYINNKTSLFLPSERNLYMDNALRKTLNENYMNTKTRYSEFLFNNAYLEYQDSFKHFKKYKSPFETQFQQLFEGSLNIDDNGEVQSLKKKNGQIIKRELFSTKLNRLLPYLIVGTPVKTYNEIIIEEPEAHLSLKSMNKLIMFISILLEKSRQVYLTTHSDVFFSRLNNFILKNPSLNVKVYELTTDNGHSILEEKVRTEFGYIVDLFKDELTDLYEDTLSIQESNLE
nr:hypothetical protein [Fredinandcohnia onubensis]